MGPGGKRSSRRGVASRRGWAAARLAPLLCTSLAPAAGASVELDGSLGNAGPVPFDGTTWQITDDLGVRSGGNLFHSLSLLDVGAGETASFHLLDPASPEPDFVIARVTGDHASEILGRIQSLHDGADLFLLNPRGFSFGPRSAVEALGSVYVSSADVLRFGDDAPFDARSSEPPGVLSADPPTAFGFLGAAPAGIRFDLDTASSLASERSDFDFPVPAGRTLAAVGGDVLVRDSDAAVGRPTIRIEGGTVALASVATGGIDVPVDVAGLAARGQAPGELGEVTIASNAVIDVQGPAGSSVGSGRVVVRSGRLVIDDARVNAIAGSGIDGPPVAIDLEVAEDAVIANGSRLIVSSQTAASGDLRLSGASVRITGSGTQIAATSRGAASPPDVEVDAGDFVLGDGAQVLLRTTIPSASATGGRFAVVADTAAVEGGASVLNESQSEATGGAIVFQAGELRVSDRGSLQSASTRSGAGGPIEIAARELAVESRGQILSQASADGPGGKIGVAADVLRITGPSEIRSRSAAAGPGGGIDLAVGALRLDAQGQVVSENQGAGAGGSIAVRATGEVVAQGRGKIVSEATGTASAAGGDVRIEAGERILVVGEDGADRDVSQLSALTSSSAAGGRGGNLRVSAPEIELRDGGQLRTSTNGAALGGSLDVVDTDRLRAVGNATVDGELVGAGLFARANGPGAEAGDGGAIRVEAREVLVEDGGEISARTFGAGDAGSLEILGAETVSVRGGPRGVSTLSTRGAQGSGGDVDIAAAELELRSGGLVSASTDGTGEAGDIRIAADRISISGSPSGLFSQTNFGGANSGVAGNIAVEVASLLVVRDGGRISVDSRGGGAAGSVAIRGGPGATIALVGGNVSARSRGSAEAGSVSIETGRDFVAGRGASVETQAEDNASGGRIAISAGRIVYASDSQLTTLVAGPPSGLGNAGDVDVPPAGTSVPDFAVLNRSAIVARAVGGNGGNIQVAANDLLASQGVVIDPTSEFGQRGEVAITSPDATLAGQITPLPVNFFDASKLLSTACEARRERTGSFVVQTRPAIGPLPDAPLAPSLLSGSGAGAAGPEAPADSRCPG